MEDSMTPSLKRWAINTYSKLGFSSPNDKRLITSVMPVVSSDPTRSNFTNMNWSTTYSPTCQHSNDWISWSESSIHNKASSQEYSQMIIHRATRPNTMLMYENLNEAWWAKYGSSLNRHDRDHYISGACTNVFHYNEDMCMVSRSTN